MEWNVFDTKHDSVFIIYENNVLFLGKMQKVLPDYRSKLRIIYIQELLIIDYENQGITLPFYVVLLKK